MDLLRRQGRTAVQPIADGRRDRRTRAPRPRRRLAGCRAVHPGPPLPPAAARLTRRRALALGLAAGGLGLAAPVLGGCAVASSDDGPDPLIPLVTRARADADLVTA